ncbi:MAG: hypothetical protein NTY64_18435 [Deltaproteobacteria bacterium]|nr:hypothetical protein [Deltaproteobacteria bacterium]
MGKKKHRYQKSLDFVDNNDRGIPLFQNHFSPGGSPKGQEKYRYRAQKIEPGREKRKKKVDKNSDNRSGSTGGKGNISAEKSGSQKDDKKFQVLNSWDEPLTVSRDHQIFDGFVKSPSAALRFTFVAAAYNPSTPHSGGFARRVPRKAGELFTKPSRWRLFTRSSIFAAIQFPWVETIHFAPPLSRGSIADRISGFQNRQNKSIGFQKMPNPRGVDVGGGEGGNPKSGEE